MLYMMFFNAGIVFLVYMFIQQYELKSLYKIACNNTAVAVSLPDFWLLTVVVIAPLVRLLDKE